MRLTCLVLATFVLSSAALPASARSAPTVGNEHATSTLPWSDVVRVRRFDPSLGTLQRVHLVIDAFVRVDLAVENVGTGPMAVSAHAIALVSVHAPTGATFAQMPFQSDAQWTLAAYDHTLDFAGASGRRSAGIGREHIDVVIEDPAQILAFLGAPGLPGVVELPVSAFGSAAVLGGPDAIQRTRLDAGVRVRVEYVFAQPTAP